METNGKLVPWKSFVRDTSRCNVSRDFSIRHVRKVKTRMKLSTEHVHKTSWGNYRPNTFTKRIVSELSTEHVHETDREWIIDRTCSQKRIVRELSTEHVHKNESWGNYRPNMFTKTNREWIIDRTCSQKRIVRELSTEHVHKNESWVNYRLNALMKRSHGKNIDRIFTINVLLNV